MKKAIVIILVIALTFTAVLLCVAICEAEETYKVRMGVSFAEENVSCVNDFTVRLADTDFIYNASSKELTEAVEYLPPLALNYNEDSCKNKPETVMELFRMALKQYFPSNKAEEFKFVSVSVKPSDTDPTRIVFWNFTAAWKSKLSPETLKQEGWKRTGLAFMGIGFNSKLEVSTAGYAMYYSDTESLRKIIQNCESIEEIGEKIMIFPPISVNQEMRVTKKTNGSTTIRSIFRSSLKKIYGEKRTDEAEKEYLLLTAERYFIGKILIETWLLTCSTR